MTLDTTVLATRWQGDYITTVLGGCRRILLSLQWVLLLIHRGMFLVQENRTHESLPLVHDVVMIGAIIETTH